VPRQEITKEQQKQILKLLKTTRLSYRQISRITKASVGFVSDFAGKHSVARPPKKVVMDELTADVVDGGDTPIQQQRKADEERKFRQEYVDALREHAFRDFLTKTIREHVQPQPPVQRHRPSRPTPNATFRYPLLVLTDWHFEELVSAEGTLGLNTYDIPTACKRVHRVANVVMDWKRDIEAASRFKVPELVVLLNGDMITGSLHGLERHSDAPNVIRAAFACGDLIAAAITDLASAFPKVRVVGVPGNHGRLPDDKKVPTKDPTRNWDYVAYQVARRRMTNNPNVEWHTFDAYGVLFEVGGHLCYAAHGNFIPNNLGVVGYGVRRFTTSLASNMSAAGKQLRYCFFGHWHHSSSSEFAGVEAFISPSLIGTQEYSFLSGGAVNRPAQELHIFDKKLGHVSRERIYGQDDTWPGTYEIQV